MMSWPLAHLKRRWKISGTCAVLLARSVRTRDGEEISNMSDEQIKKEEEQHEGEHEQHEEPEVEAHLFSAHGHTKNVTHGHTKNVTHGHTKNVT
jgi:hypothetical protein